MSCLIHGVIIYLHEYYTITSPKIKFIKNLWDRVIVWQGDDREDGRKLLYSYRVDKEKWSEPLRIQWMFISHLDLKPGKHKFEVKAIDSEGMESKTKKVRFKVKERRQHWKHSRKGHRGRR